MGFMRLGERPPVQEGGVNSAPFSILFGYVCRMPILSTFAHADLPSVFSWQAVAYMREIWPSLFTGRLAWLREPYPASLNPFHVVIHHDEVLVAYAAVIRVTVSHDGTDYAIDGVGNVLTATPYRGRGYGRQVVERVNDRLDASDADAAALFCAPDLEPFYAGAGWLPCPGGTRVGTGAQSCLYSGLRMMRLLSSRGRTAAKSLLTTTMDVSWAW
jgi:GNAT superfamily N-acetyltransferase